MKAFPSFIGSSNPRHPLMTHVVNFMDSYLHCNFTEAERKMLKSSFHFPGDKNLVLSRRSPETGQLSGIFTPPNKVFVFGKIILIIIPGCCDRALAAVSVTSSVEQLLHLQLLGFLSFLFGFQFPPTVLQANLVDFLYVLCGAGRFLQGEALD